MNLTELGNFCQTNKRYIDICHDKIFIDTWMKRNHPELIELFKGYLNFHPELSFLEIISKLLDHIELGELVTFNSYLNFGNERLFRMAGRQGNEELFKFYTATLGHAIYLLKHFIIGLLEERISQSE